MNEIEKRAKVMSGLRRDKLLEVWKELKDSGKLDEVN